MGTKSVKTEELDSQPQSQTVPNYEWAVLRALIPENLFEVLSTVAANRFRYKRASSHRFSEEDTKRMFCFNKGMLRRCNVQCISSPTCAFGLNVECDLNLAKLFFQNKNLKQLGHKVKLDPKEECSDLI
eukprot:snap_masked-scaffold_37-processed-gene-2.82-mRNA-1 protein AED:1.00 eAED:1.00 QI:0/-1/0/0/-1/1/1/0/128